MDFNNEYIKRYNMLGESAKVALATAVNEDVTSRTMSVIFLNNKIYFQTGKDMEKAQQIACNPNVAISFKNVQIKGICHEIGKPTEHKFFLDTYKRCFPSAYRKYSNSPDERVYEISIKKITFWEYENNFAYRREYNQLDEQFVEEKFELPED